MLKNHSGVFHMVELIKEKTGIDFFEEKTLEEAIALAKEHEIHVEKHFTGVGHIINEVLRKIL